MKAYHITQWNPLYERADTRKTDYMGWFAKQTKLVGTGIGKTMREPYPRNAQLYGVWTIIEILASQSAVNERGWLIRGGEALTAETMADLVPTIPPEAFQMTLDWFSQSKPGWLEYVECPHLSDKSPGLFSTCQEVAGKNSRSFSTCQEVAGKNSATERETERRETESKQRESQPHSPAARASSIPSIPDVRTWAGGAQIDPDFAQLKVEQAIERGDFAKPNWKGDRWQSKLERFWKEDGEAWTRKMKKNAAAPASRPDGWKDGDMEFWWTDPLADVRASLRGAALTDKKTAARLAEIISERERKNV